MLPGYVTKVTSPFETCSPREWSVMSGHQEAGRHQIRPPHPQGHELEAIVDPTPIRPQVSASRSPRDSLAVVLTSEKVTTQSIDCALEHETHVRTPNSTGCIRQSIGRASRARRTRNGAESPRAQEPNGISILCLHVLCVRSQLGHLGDGGGWFFCGISSSHEHPLS